MAWKLRLTENTATERAVTRALVRELEGELFLGAVREVRWALLQETFLEEMLQLFFCPLLMPWTIVKARSTRFL